MREYILSVLFTLSSPFTFSKNSLRLSENSDGAFIRHFVCMVNRLGMTVIVAAKLSYLINAKNFGMHIRRLLFYVTGALPTICVYFSAKKGVHVFFLIIYRIVSLE
jgi:hypothetical protein